MCKFWRAEKLKIIQKLIIFINSLNSLTGLTSLTSFRERSKMAKLGKSQSEKDQVKKRPNY